MPIKYRIDIERKLVHAWGLGTIRDEDVLGYQREAWSSPEVTGYNLLIDMTDAMEFAVPSASRVRDLAELSARMDAGESPAKIAVVAPQEVAYGLGRMYKAYREAQPESRKQIEIFRTLEEALQFLGIEEDPPRRS